MSDQLDIQTIRDRVHPGGPLQLVRELEEMENYKRPVMSYRSGDLQIQAFLTIPKGEEPAEGWPVIIFNRGHVDIDLYQVDRQYLRYIDYLARAGFVVFKSDYRGIGQSEGEPANLTSAGNALDVLNGFSALKEWAKDQNMKLGKVGIWGHSMGAMVALECMLANTEIVAGVLWCGFTIPFEKAVERWSHHDRMRARAAEMLESYGRPEDKPEIWQAISPFYHLAGLTGPIQLHHGMKDDKIPYEDSVELDRELQKVGKAGGLFLYENGDHNLSGEDLPIGMNRAAEFFKEKIT